MMDTMEKRKKKLELELLRGILGAIEADIDLEHDFSELLEGAPIKGRKTVPRQTNVPSDEPDEQEESFEGTTVLRPRKWDIIDIPAIGAKTFIVVMNDDNKFEIVEGRFMGTQMELLMLAQDRLFPDYWQAELYAQKCKAVIGVIKSQLPELD